MKTNKIGLVILFVIVLIMGTIIVTNSNLLGEKEIDILSKEEAVKLLEEKYEIAGKLYMLSNEYFVLSDKEKIWEQEGYTEYGKEITNYEYILKNNFSEKMITDFEKNAIFLKISDGKAYVLLGGLGFCTYEGVEEFKDINITDNKITSTVKTKHNDDIGNFYGYIESTFTLVKNGDKWLIDEFDSSDIFNADLDKVTSNIQLNNHIALFRGIEIYKNTGVQEFEWVEDTEANKEKYSIKYYNYDKNEYKGETEGIFGNEEVFVGTSYVENVSKFAISKKYNAIPRQSTVIDELPNELNDMMDYSNVEIESVDLDGDGKTEYIVSAQKTTLKEDYDVDENEAFSEIILFDSNYSKIATLASWTVNFEENTGDWYLNLDDVTYIDIDNDGVMEIVIQIPTYKDGWKLSVLKYSDNKLEGETNLKVNLQGNI